MTSPGATVAGASVVGAAGAAARRQLGEERVQGVLVLEPDDRPAVLVVGPDVGHGLEVDAAGGHRLHLLGQLEQVEVLVDGQRVRRRRHQLALLAEVEQDVLGQHLAQHAGDEHLLADDPVEVAAGQLVPLPHELQRVARR